MTEPSGVTPIRLISQQTDADLERLSTTLKSGGGGGTFDGMEHRVARLEADMSEVKRDLTDIKVMLARIETQVSHQVSYKWLSIYVIGLAALVLRHEILGLFPGGTP